MSCFDLKKEIPKKLKNKNVFQVSSSALKAKLTCCDDSSLMKIRFCTILIKILLGVDGWKK
jgi:hypothetical protein